MSAYEVVSAGSCSDFEHNIKEILSTDDKHRFVSFVASPSKTCNSQSCLSTILQWICSSNAISCATALLEGETGLKVDLNQPVLGGYYPLHLAAENLFPRLVELFILHGAQTNVRCVKDVKDGDSWFFPFQVALRAASNHECLDGWTSGEYTLFKLIIKLCLPEMKDALDTIKPLVSGTLAVETLVSYYVNVGMLTELAVLTMAAPEEVFVVQRLSIDGCTEDGSWTMFQCYESKIASQIDCMLKYMGTARGAKKIQKLQKKVMWTRSAYLLLEIFERASDDIEKLKEKMAEDVSLMKAVKHFCIRLSEAGFDFMPKDIFLHNILCGKLRKPIKIALEQSECGTQQLGLQLPSQRTQVSSAAHLLELSLSNFERDIKEILSSDDKDKFLSFLRSQLDYFKRLPSCLSTIFEWACSLNALNCATALLEGETSLKVDVNHPVLGGYYPLHLVARNLFPRLVNLFSHHGALTDIKCDDSAMEEDIGLSPLNIALKAASNHECVRGWTPNQGLSSTYALITLLCMPEMKDALDTNKLLARSSSNLEMVAYHYGKEGKLIELAILLIVAREKVLGPITFQRADGSGCGSGSIRRVTISQYVNQELELLIDFGFKYFELNDGKYKKEMQSMKFTWWLLNVFKRAGHDIEEYQQLLQPDMPKDTVHLDLSNILYKYGYHPLERDVGREYFFQLDRMRKRTKMALKQSECGAQQLQVQLPSKRALVPPSNNVPCTMNTMTTLSPPGTQSLSSAVRSIHTNRVSKSMFGFQCSKNVDFPVMFKRSKAIEQRVPEFLSGEKWAYFSTMIKRGIKRA